jgi:hypothetical protein
MHVSCLPSLPSLPGREDLGIYIPLALISCLHGIIDQHTKAFQANTHQFCDSKTMGSRGMGRIGGHQIAV